jgi:hypothetical protein
VLSDGGVARHRVSRSRSGLGARGRWPLRCSFRHPNPQTRLRGSSSRTVQLSFTVLAGPAAGTDPVTAALLGFGPLQRMGRRESTSLAGTGSHLRGARHRLGPPGFPRASTSGSQSAGYGAAHRFSQPPSGVLPLTTVLPFSGRWRSWGCPFRGLHLLRSPDGSSPPACPPDVAPSGWPAPILGGSTGRRTDRCLG